MSFRGEIKDFLSTALAVRKSFRDDANSEARNNYYKAMIERAKHSGSNASARLAQQDRQFQQRMKLLERGQGIRADKLDLLRQKQAGADGNATVPTAPDQEGPKTPDAGAIAGAHNEAVPDEDGDEGAMPAAVGDDDEDDAGELDPNEVTGQSVTPATAYDQDEQLDEEDFAKGGAVGDDDMPDRQATDDAMSSASVRAAQPQRSTKANGFDMKEVLGQWAAASKSTPKSNPQSNPAVGGYTSSANTAPQAQAALAQPKPAQQGAVDSEQMPPMQGFGDEQPKGAVDAGPDLADQHAPNSQLSPAGGDKPVSGPADEAPVNPVAIGLHQIMDAYGLRGGPAVGDHPGHADMAAAKGAYTDQEVAAITKAVDPDDKLTPAAKYIAALDAGVRTNIAKGHPKDAAKFAQGLIEYGQRQSKLIGQETLKAIQAGDMDKATKLITHAFDYVPNGAKLDAVANQDGSVSVKVNDETNGVTLDLGTMGPQQLYKFSLGIANGTEYMKQMAQVASGNIGLVRKTGGATAGGTPKASTMRDRSTSATMIDAADAQQQGATETAAAPDKYRDLTKGVADMVLRANDVTPQQAIGVAKFISDPNTPRDQFRQMEDGSVVISHAGRAIKLPREAFLQAVSIRGERLAQTNKDAGDKKVREDRAAADSKAFTAVRQKDLERDRTTTEGQKQLFGAPGAKRPTRREETTGAP